MAVSKTPPQKWIDAAFRALAEGGPETVRVETLAASLGVTKGGFYWHFTDRSDLLDRVLDAWEQLVVDTVIATVDAARDEPRTRLQELFEIALRIDSSSEVRKVELAIREWARHDPAVALRLNRVDERRMSYLRGLFGPLCTDDADTEARCLVAFALFVGSPLITVEHPQQGRGDVVRRALERLLDGT